jgi:hypothetical protein
MYSNEGMRRSGKVRRAYSIEGECRHQVFAATAIVARTGGDEKEKPAVT